MPPYGPPYPEPVRFDAQLATDALNALNSAIAQLSAHTSTDLHNASLALDGWTGHHADSFSNVDLPWIRREASRILDGMMVLASRLGAAGPAAQGLQHQHDLANQRWYDRRAAALAAGDAIGGPQ